MKKLIILAACMGVTAVAFGQGQVNFNSRVTVDGINAGVTYEGVLVDGANGWKAQLYAGDEPSALVPVSGVVDFRTGAAAGYISGGAVTIEGKPNGSQVWLAIAAWNIADGASYEVASAAFGPVGMSLPIQVSLDGPPNTPPNMIGLQPWSVAIIPEPSTMALGLLGFAALMLRRRR